MKTKLVLLIAIAGMFTFSSCKKCLTCQSDSSPYVSDICKPKDYTQNEWRDFVDEVESDNDVTCK